VIEDEANSVTNCFGPHTLSDLVQGSEAIVRVIVKSRMPSQLEPGGDTLITTDYNVAVIERFKGKFNSGADMTVRTRGGFVRFSNSTTAEIRVANDAMHTGEDLVLFLFRVDDSRPLIPGFHGMFTLTTDGKTLPRAYRSEELFKKYNGMPREDFLEIVRSLSTQ
jgi:hypothetical protein